jgi:hypothetical protein
MHPSIHLFIHPIHRVCRWYVGGSVGQSVGLYRVSFFEKKKKERKKKHEETQTQKERKKERKDEKKERKPT